jgi:hypothetical protein
MRKTTKTLIQHRRSVHSLSLPYDVKGQLSASENYTRRSYLVNETFYKDKAKHEFRIYLTTSLYMNTKLNCMLFVK